ncbi:maleylpyruvate isomerase family mycothiol-dependent enzyme [Paeniglutamicibacter psychrophenolicus]|uniref:maleylpyruvate isomerase family mycothiol-dependent enzyme n=1 Tax=Paeniglutamicibacter psychrophenolicus TaxID=257454 RepID=UPI002789F694|nr:maleylpyruvate isomerase family mycothiol-dependent enzyme [Paeniglutamicibacter psychrophenolicus]MDQ0092845.1 maleylpyruvate isomerase [Paeniglutamicibacter psychrophenolicus]
MINPARLHSDLSRLGRETSMMLATIETLSADEMAAPSLCEGWSRADVIAHLASNGRALVKLIDWATTGDEQQLYASPEARAEEIAALAALPGHELVEKFRTSAEFFAEQTERLTGQLAVEEVDLHGKVIPATSIVALRIAEIVVHHQDLDTAWTIAEADPDSQLDAVEAAVRTMRAKNAPGMTLVTEEGDTWVIGDGALRVESDREGMLEWLSRGQGRHVEANGELPVLPAW